MPASLLTAVSAPICAGLVAVTVTPGSTPPCASLISPLMLPVELAPPPCAKAADDASIMASAQLRSLQPFMCVNLRSAQESKGDAVTLSALGPLPGGAGHYSDGANAFGTFGTSRARTSNPID